MVRLAGALRACGWASAAPSQCVPFPMADSVVKPLLARGGHTHAAETALTRLDVFPPAVPYYYKY